MSRRLPPLTAIRAFEAAARLLSFTKAAQELNVTQAAVSHQVKALEGWLNLPLFRRSSRALFLTDEGQTYLAVVRDCLDKLAEGTHRLQARDKAGRLTVSTFQSFAAVWLVPRLGRFRLQHPEIDVWVAASDAIVDFNQEDIDCGIRYGTGRWPGVKAVRFMTESIFPVCSPKLLNGPHPLRVPEDLVRHTLLHDHMHEDWRMWLMAAGVADIDSARGPTFSHSSMVLQAAIDGQGVALGRSALMREAIAEGKLVQPFKFSLNAHHSYYFICPEASADRPKVIAFRDWLFAEAERDGLRITE
ncbi:MAG: transcriptional regulator GcvA [Alphaproteobacteria bacterium]|nr:transcriptional regulator GcvA [Alphaproteobacteria bacterium]MBU0795922.1 transcriptional regulator GcvA [Alphaproteobacteria bacterium]MBU0886959.1 transcriptional regulator GcvA [Alphaproteobacteria bacterium]MBU1813185.1 transcriptional regulator GcvA [Alphaproteobacteria bacterium]MBU2090606.1 transcriptional regulator GcvA [Alphaproteobacteria bacterium]